jgi:hypothetical protein
MRTYTKAMVMISFLLLAACGGSGETKVTKIDGTSNATAEQSLRKMLYGMKDQESIQWQNDIRLIKSRYEGDFGKMVAGKSLEDLRPMIDDSRKYWVERSRALHIGIEQKEIDSLQAKLKEQTDLGVNSVITSKTEARIRMYEKSIEEMKALSDEDVLKTYGCSC